MTAFISFSQAATCVIFYMRLRTAILSVSCSRTNIHFWFEHCGALGDTTEMWGVFHGKIAVGFDKSNKAVMNGGKLGLKYIVLLW